MEAAGNQRSKAEGGRRRRCSSHGHRHREPSSGSDMRWVHAQVVMPAAAAAEDEMTKQIDMAETEDALEQEVPVGAVARPVASSFSRKPRLMIKQMELENFKSYAGVIKVGPFHKSMTSVIGPNGSGKSNVIDAILFVCGFASAKLRMKNLNELIHKEGKGGPVCQFAKVTIFFQVIRDHEVGDGFDVLDDSEFAVTREVRRTTVADKSKGKENGEEKNVGQSRYLLDNKGVDKSKVMTLLKKHGIDLTHNRFLILQGEVEQISMMSPLIFLEYLEEIIGSNEFHEAIEEAKKEMEQLNEKRNGKQIDMRAAEGHMRALESHKDAAEAFLAIEAEMQTKRSWLYQKKAANSDAAVVKKGEQREAMEVELREEKEKIAAQEAENADRQQRYDALKKERDAQKKQLDDASSKYAKFERQFVEYQQKQEHMKKERKKSEATAVEEARKLEEKKEELTRLQAECTTLEKHIAARDPELNAARGKLEQMREDLQGETEPLRKKFEATQQERAPKKQALDGLKSKVTLKKNEAQLIEDKREEMERERQEATQALQDHDKATAQGQTDLEQLMAEVAEKKAMVEEKRAVAERAVAACPGLEEALKAARERLDQANSASADTGTRSSEQIKALKKAKINGFIGRLGDLGRVSSEYDIAASTAGGSLDNVLVADMDAAQRVVDYCRQHQLGVVTCLVLNHPQVQRFAGELNKPFAAPHGSQRLYDLVQCAPEHSPAFFKCFNNTLVCKGSKEEAKRTALNGTTKYRVVTMDGVIINQNGTMEGGGRPICGRIGKGETAPSSISAEELRALEQAVEVADTELQRAREAKDEAEEAQRGLLRDLKKKETELRNKKHTRDSADAKRKVLEERVARVAQQASEAGGVSAEEEAQTAQIAAEVEKLEVQVTDAQAAVDEVDGKLADLRQQIDQAGGEELRMQKDRVAEMDKALKKVKKQKGAADAKIESCNEALPKLEEAVSQAKETAENLREKLKGMKAEFESQLEKAQEVQDLVTKEQATLKEREDALELMKAEYEASRRRIDTKRLTQLERELKDLLAKVEGEQKAAADWRASLDALRIQVRDAAEKTAQEMLARGISPDDEEMTPRATAKVDDLSEEALGAIDLAQLDTELTDLKSSKDSMECNIDSIADYYERVREYRAVRAEFDAVTAERESKRQHHDNLCAQRKQKFMAGFKVIATKLKEMYRTITFRGDAELELVEQNDPFGGGINFAVRPPEKSWKNILHLSGGEKTLSSLALIFALHHYQPTPLYVMDEIDAALDFRNVSIIANYIKQRTSNAQFIIISLRNQMFELADRLVGIYKVNDKTQSVAIDPGCFTITVR